MANETANHGFVTQAKGTENWHIPLNSNFEQLDQKVIIRDIVGNLGIYTPDNEALFLATDSKELYIGDGSEWTLWGKIGRSDSEIQQFIQDELGSSPTLGGPTTIEAGTGAAALTISNTDIPRQYTFEATTGPQLILRDDTASLDILSATRDELDVLAPALMEQGSRVARARGPTDSMRQVVMHTFQVM